VLAFLSRTNRIGLSRYAWYGVEGAVVASVTVGGAILVFYGNLSESNQVLFEGLAALLAVGVLTSMIYWMAVKGRYIKKQVEHRIEIAAAGGTVLAVAGLTFVLVFREGLETVLFVTPFLVIDVAATLAGAAAGLAFALGLAYAIFRVGVKLDLRKFFYFTSILLVLLAAGLLGYGIHELIEYGELQGMAFGWWGQSAYDLATYGISANSLFGHKGAVGSIAAVMLGYSVSPEWARIVAQATYLAVALPLVILVYRRPEWLSIARAWLRSWLRAEAAPTTAPHEE